MQNLFTVLWWVPYVLFVFSVSAAFATCKCIFRMILLRRDREVAVELAKRDPALEKVAEFLNPWVFLPEALTWLVVTASLFGLAVFWARQLP